MSQRGGLPTHSSANSAVFVAFLAALLIAPFGNGAGSPVAMAVSAFCFGAIALALAGDLVWSRTAFAIAPARLALALSCFGAVAAWCLVQAWVPVPPGFADPGWSILGEALHIAVTGRISAAPVNTLMATTKLMTAGLVFFTALQLSSDPARSIVGIRTILLIIVAYSIWGVIDVGLGRTVAAFGPMDSSSTGSLPGMAKSTLPNPNHFATLCLMGLASALTLVLRDIRRLGAKLGMGSSRLADFAPICGDGSCVIILLVALYLSKSVVGIRLGFVIFTVVIGIVMLRFRSSGKTRHGFWTLAALGLAIAFLLASFFGADFPARPDGATNAGWIVDRAVFGAIFDNALFGTGFGTFRDVFPIYQTSDMGYGAEPGTAHNAYLEAMLGLGVPMALALFVAIGAIVWRVFCGALLRKQHISGPIAAASASTVVLAHNMVESPFHTHAVALVFAALLGFGCAQSWSTQDR